MANGASTSSLHQTAIGQPMYGSVNKSIMLDCKTENSGTTKGTEYRLAYNFKANYIYKVTINASCVGGTSARLRLLQANGGGANMICNGSDIIDPNASGNGYVSNTIISGTTWNDYTFNLPVYATQWSYLNVSAIPSLAADLQTINVRKITITETPPAPAFSINNISVPCGSTAPQTFAVANAYNSPGVTSYEWDLGANNGWLYNGIAAPQYISTTANTLILAPSGSIALQNVSVTVRMNQQDYRTYTATVTNTAPSYTISGPSNLCTNATYQILGLPQGSTILWSATPSGILTVTPGVGSAILTQNTSGYATLTATINNACGTFTVTKTNIAVGTPIPRISCPQYQGVPFDPYSVINCIIEDNEFSNVQWSVIGGTIISGQGTGNVTIQLGAGGIRADNQFSISATGTTNCGTWSGYGYFDGFIKGGQGEFEPIDFNMVAYPNPASNMISLENVTALPDDYGVELYNFESNKLSLSQKIKKGTKSAKIQVSHLPKGKYVLAIRDKKGKLIKTQQVILK